MTSRRKSEPGQGFAVEQAELARHLRLAKGVANKNSTMPMLAHVKVTAEGERLEINATDLNVSATTTGTAECVGRLEVALPAQALTDAVGRLRSGPLRVELIQDGWVALTQGKAVFKIPAVRAADYPKVHALPDEVVEVDAAAMLALVERTIFSVCKDETRFHLNGCLLEADGETTRMVSTDGHRLTMATATTVLRQPGASGVIVPMKGLLEVRKLLGDAKVCRVGFTAKAIVIAVEGALLGVKLIDAVYPPYGQVVPDDRGISATIDRLQFLDAVRRVQLMTSETRGVVFHFGPDALGISSSNSDTGSASDEVDAAIEGAPPEGLGANPRYLVDLLERLAGDKVVLGMGATAQDPMLFRSESDPTMLGVVMPMRPG